MIFFTDCDAVKISEDRVNATWLSYPKKKSQTCRNTYMFFKVKKENC